MLTILHGADFHLDAPFASLPPDKARQRREEQRALLDRLADLAREAGADLVLLSGDLLDSGQTYQETVEALSRTLGRMGIPVFIAPGNHDCYGPRSVYANTAWPDNVHIFSTVAVESVELPRLGCTVHGAAFTTPQADRSPLMGFAAPRDGRIHLMALHGDVGGQGRYGPIDEADIAASGLTYLALGHIHACSGLRKAGDTWWAYPGCPEGRGFDETGDKGVLAVTVGDDPGDLTARFVPLAGRRYEIVEADVTGAESAREALEAVLPAQPCGHCCRILLTGQRSFGPPDLADLAALAQPYYYSVTLRDQTRELRDLWERAGEDSLTGLVLRRLKADGGEEARLAARFALAALENGEDPCP